MSQEQTIESVVARLEGKKVRVTYYASETVYYETVIEAPTRGDADDLYYSGSVDPVTVDSGDYETYDITEEDV